MKEIPKDDIIFLHHLSEKINTQNKAATHYPIWLVMAEVEVPNYNHEGEHSVRDENYDGEVCEKCETAYADGEGEDYPDECEECPSEAFHTFDYEERIQENGGVYFTFEACKEYCQSRSYNYRKAHPYAISMYYSDEMKKVMDIISSLTREEGSKNPLR